MLFYNPIFFKRTTKRHIQLPTHVYIMSVTKIYGTVPSTNNNNPPPPPNNNNQGAPSPPQKPNNNSNKTSFFKNINLRKILILCGVGFVLIIAGLVSFIAAVRYGTYGSIPTRAELKAIRNPRPAEIYSIDNKLLGRLYSENRSYVEYNQISPYVITALIATEDARFFEHEGIDTRSLLRVLLKTILMGDDSGGGGSTLSQQIIKNLFPRQQHGRLTMPVNKVREALIARRLEDTYDKNQILTLYLNVVPFGENVYGIEAAARRFFNIGANELKPEQAAVLVGMLKANTQYNPRLHPEKATERRNVVLSQMAKYKYMSAAQAETLKKMPIQLNYNVESLNDGLAPHLREKLRLELKKWLNEHPKADGTIYNIYNDGLKIYTTIDSRLQNYAEQAVNEHMAKLQKQFFDHWKNQNPWGTDQNIVEVAKAQSDRYQKLKKAGVPKTTIDKIFNTPTQITFFEWDNPKGVQKLMTPNDSLKHYLKFLNTGFMAIEPSTGYVKAWVGSINHKYFKYDYTNAHRQVGSTFKPIVYAAALENGSDPCKLYPNELRVYTDYQNWTPKNSDDQYGGYYSMIGAMAKSINTISVQVLFEAGLENVINLAQNLGIYTPIPKMPSIALGTAELSLQEMISVYSAFDNNGIPVRPLYLLKVTDKNGALVADFNPKSTQNKTPAIQASTARTITHILEAVVDSGTARRLRTEYKLTNNIAGKTGTTQSQADGWFIGYTPDLVAGAWVGGFDQRIRFKTTALGQGATMALPIWALFTKKMYSDINFKGSSYKRFSNLTETLAQQLNCPFKVEDYNAYYASQQNLDFEQVNTKQSVFETTTPPPATPTNPIATNPTPPTPNTTPTQPTRIKVKPLNNNLKNKIKPQPLPPPVNPTDTTNTTDNNKPNKGFWGRLFKK